MLGKVSIAGRDGDDDDDDDGDGDGNLRPVMMTGCVGEDVKVGKGLGKIGEAEDATPKSCEVGWEKEVVMD